MVRFDREHEVRARDDVEGFVRDSVAGSLPKRMQPKVKVSRMPARPSVSVSASASTICFEADA